MKAKIFTLAVITLCAVAIYFFLPSKNFTTEKNDLSNFKKTKQSGAAIALDLWHFERAYPGNTISSEKFTQAFNQNKANFSNRVAGIPGNWEPLGPQNVGGRMLCLAFHPTDEDVIYAGSASGGLWKTTTQGVGENAWQYVATGFPVLGVGAIVIDPNNPDIILIGTGEVYGVGFAEPGIINRQTRGIYGIGILKSIDGGASWLNVLTFSENQIKGVQDIAINPQNTQEMFAATTDGVYRSTNGGDTWGLVFTESNCIDIEIDPTNSAVVYVTQGNLNYALDPSMSGIFKSTNGGDSFTELQDPGLIDAWSGSAKLSFDPTNSNVLYASIQMVQPGSGSTTSAGIYKSINNGVNWNNINNQNIAKGQGWYSHDIAINPMSNSEVINVGIDSWKSTDGGNNFLKKSDWMASPLGQLPLSGDYGNNEWVHADIHAVYYHPLNNKIFFATDGGIFSSSDGGETHTTHNGGLQTAQFYANMSSSAANPSFIIAGTQDNGTFIYRDSPEWYRVLGGDGLSAAVDNTNDQIVFGSYQFLIIQRSNDGGFNFVFKGIVYNAGDYAQFSGPFELAPSDNTILYGGAQFLYKSTNSADNWSSTTNQRVDGTNFITKIAVSPNDPNLIYLATAPDPLSPSIGTPKIMKSTNGGQTFTILTGLPDRLCKDITFDPSDETRLFAVFSGFGTDHVYKTTNGGGNWTAVDNGLPDLPTNTVLIDPEYSDDIYVGNDLGVYYSADGGSSWEIFSDALPEATMVYDLHLSSNRQIRIATHGHGIWQRSVVNGKLGVDDYPETTSEKIKMFPNPASHSIHFSSETFNIAHITLYDILGANVIEIGDRFDSVDVSVLKSGTYLVRCILSNGSIVTKHLIKE